jgi:hypothetical protein
MDTHANLFAPAARGDFTLPAKLLAMREGIARLDAEPRPVIVTDLDEHARLIEETITAAVAGQSLPDTSAVQTARAQSIEAADRQTILIGATGGFTSRLSGAIEAAGDEIITAHLRPAHDALIAELTATLLITGEYNDEPAAALTASTKVRTAFAALPGLRAGFDVLGSARRVIEMCGYRPTKDVDNQFSYIRNINELQTPGLRQHGAKPPWAEGGVTWLIRNGGHLWMPTADEQDARWQEVFGAALDERKRNQHDLAGYRAIA